jgi:hypothetical protein
VDPRLFLAASVVGALGAIVGMTLSRRVRLRRMASRRDLQESAEESAKGQEPEIGVSPDLRSSPDERRSP